MGPRYVLINMTSMVANPAGHQCYSRVVHSCHLLRSWALYPESLLPTAMQVRFIVMNNIFYNSLPISKRYDLKGSTLGRTSGAEPRAGAILKDLDLDIKLKLEEGWHDRCADQDYIFAGVVEFRLINVKCYVCICSVTAAYRVQDSDL